MLFGHSPKLLDQKLYFLRWLTEQCSCSVSDKTFLVCQTFAKQFPRSQALSKLCCVVLGTRHGEAWSSEAKWRMTCLALQVAWRWSKHAAECCKTLRNSAAHSQEKELKRWGEEYALYLMQEGTGFKECLKAPYLLGQKKRSTSGRASREWCIRFLFSFPREHCQEICLSWMKKWIYEDKEHYSGNSANDFSSTHGGGAAGMGRRSATLEKKCSIFWDVFKIHRLWPIWSRTLFQPLQEWGMQARQCAKNGHVKSNPLLSGPWACTAMLKLYCGMLWTKRGQAWPSEAKWWWTCLALSK